MCSLNSSTLIVMKQLITVELMEEYPDLAHAVCKIIQRRISIQGDWHLIRHIEESEERRHVEVHSIKLYWIVIKAIHDNSRNYAFQTMLILSKKLLRPSNPNIYVRNMCFT